ncbi:MAG: YidC/Oxa1 family membrane protein insertase [Clostridia bacterium]
MIQFFNTIITRPFGWVLYQLYSFIGSYGVALILFTIFSKLIMLPFQMKSKKSMVGMQLVQPKMKELEKKYKGDKERYAIAVQKLYKEENVSMMGGCLPLLITMPIMFGLYAVVRQPLTFMFGLSEDIIKQLADAVGVAIDAKMSISAMEIQIAAQMGNFVNKIQAIVPNIQAIDFNFLGINLAEVPQFTVINALWIIPILSGGTSFLYSWIAKKYQGTTGNTNAQTAGMSNMMTYMMPIMSIWIAFAVPAGLGFYWIINNLLMVAQEPLLNWYYTKYKPSKVKAGGKGK